MTTQDYSDDPGGRVDPDTGDDIWDPKPKRSYDASTKSSSGGGGSSSGKDSTSSSDNTGSGSGKDYNDTDDQSRFLGIAGNPDIWRNTETGDMFVVYYAYGTEPPIPLLYRVPDKDRLQSYFGEGQTIVYDKEFTTAQMDSTGAIWFGESTSLKATEGDPWTGYKRRMERMRDVSPWFDDEELLALMGGAYLEKRNLQPWELQSTAWYQEHNDKEREWIEMSFGDPSSAAAKLQNDLIFVTSLFDKIGADGNDPALIEWMSTKFSTGAWSQIYLTDQVEAITSGWSTVDSDLQAYIDSEKIETTTSEQYYTQVRDLYEEWLGPGYPPSDADVAKWATAMRNTPDGQDELISMLRGQRLALYSGYEDENLTYRDISGPWRNLGSQMWGETMDETSDVFQQMIRMNDYAGARKLLRTEGLRQNKGKVWEDSVNQFKRARATDTRRGPTLG